MNQSSKRKNLFFYLFFFSLVTGGGSFHSIEAKPYQEILIKEKIIKDHVLAKLDSELNKAYTFLQLMLSEQERLKLLKKQKEWLQERNRNLDGPSQSLYTLYEARLKALKMETKKAYDQTLGRIITAAGTCSPQEGLQALQHCELDLCLLYKAYFIFPENPAKAQKLLEGILKQLKKEEFQKGEIYTDLQSYQDYIRKKPFRFDMPFYYAYLAQNSPFKIISEQEELFIYEKIPFWLVCANPFFIKEISSYLYRAPFKVVNPLSPKHQEHFEKLEALLVDIESGRWVTTSYMSWAGTIRFDIDCAHEHERERLFFAPKTFNILDTEKSLLSLRSWAFLGIWNFKKYQEFLMLFEKAAAELSRFYELIPELQKYTKFAPQLLASYIYERDPSFSPTLETQAFQKLSAADLTAENISSLTSGFSKKDLSESLSIAILKRAPRDVICYLLDQGADPDALIYQESALMKAADQPEIIALLLKRGAKVDLPNPFGKTALFYAIQFGSLESVRIIVEAGANINHSLNSLKDFKKLSEELTKSWSTAYLLENVALFTPLIYALRYGKSDVINFLKSKGATIGAAAEGVIEAWISKKDHP